MQSPEMMEYKRCAMCAIKNGVLKIAEPKVKPNKPRRGRPLKYPPDVDRKELKRKNNTKRYYAHKEEYLKQGLTAHGLPRDHFRLDLSGWTDEQKRERQLQQQRDWHKKEYHEHRHS